MASVVRALKGKTIGGLLKKGWDEIPEVVATTFLALFGLGLGGIGVYNYYAKNGNNRRYKVEYTVIRPDDPRVEKIWKDKQRI